jgi:hypothetical protein
LFFLSFQKKDCQGFSVFSFLVYNARELLPYLTAFNTNRAMPRQSRIDAPGALHHVIIRGD